MPLLPPDQSARRRRYGNGGNESFQTLPKIDIIREMKLLAMILFLPMAAFAATVEPLPPSEFADTEVSTNIAFVVERPAMTRIEFTVALDATPTNNVEVAIGTDENGDGNLGVDEAAYTFGYDCGKWFKRSKSEVVVEQWNCSSFLTRGGDAASPLFAASPLTVTEEDIARGWQLWEVRTNSNVCYRMPEGVTMASNRWVRGAFEDCSIG